MSEDTQIKSWYGPGGSLLTSEALPGITQELYPLSRYFYKGQYFVCESITQSAAEAISKALNLDYQGVIK